MIPELERIASIENLVDKKLYFLALLTREAEKKRVQPIVVGGSAVDIFTEGMYPSYDIDLVGSRRIIGEILEKNFSFKPSGRHWVNEQIGFYVEIPDSTLAGDRDRIFKMKIRDEDLNVYMIGLEDLIVDRMSACIYWKSQTDCEQARFLLKKYRDKLDIEYMEKKAKEEGLLEVLRNFTEGRSKGRYAKKGWFEEQMPVITEKGLEKKAPRHREAAAKKKLRDTLRNPSRLRRT